MKKILAIAIVAAALFSLASCQKVAVDEPTKTERIITGAFSNDGTKTTLDTDNITPLWSVGDVIRVLDNTDYQDITLKASNITDSGKKITFTTTLTGAMLYAVYPASATSMESCSNGNVTFTIPAIQDGTFGSANICIASGDGVNSNAIYFSNATAVVEMTLATGVVGAKFAAANNIAGDMTATMGAKGAISGMTPSLSSTTVSVSDTKTPTGGKFYMAVAPGETGSVTITCNTINKSGSANRSTKTLEMDHIYAMNLSGMTIDSDIDLTGQHGILNGQEYVIIKAKYNGTDNSYLKWATQNLAVTASGKAKWNGTDYVIGDYFQWAASYDGYGITAEASKIPENLVIYDSFTTKYTGGASNSFTFKYGKQFNIGKAPYGGTSYTKYTSGSVTLESSDDVASIVLGGTWRMPTGGNDGEFNAMRATTYWAWDNSTDKGYYVFKPGVGTSGAAGGTGSITGTDDKTKALLFFPAAGIGNNTTISEAGVSSSYWSSTLDSGNVSYAYRLAFSSSVIAPVGSRYRYLGHPVRPVTN